MTEPKCPDCATQGIDHIISKDAVEHSKKRDPWFYVVYCNQCGHVYGVFAKHVMADINQPVFNLSR